MPEHIDRRLSVVILGAICILTSIAVSSVSLTQVIAQMKHMQNINATADTRTIAFEAYREFVFGD